MKSWGFSFSLILLAGGSLFVASAAHADNCNPDLDAPIISLGSQLIEAECRNEVGEVTLNPNGDGSNTGDFMVSDLCQAIVNPTYDNGLGVGAGQPCDYPTDGSSASCDYPLNLNGNAGLYVVLVFASDFAGNPAMQPVVIQVMDTQPPNIGHNGNKVLECNSPSGVSAPSVGIDESYFTFQDSCLPDGTIFKNYQLCDAVNNCTSGLPTNEYFFGFGETTITARAEDEYGNAGTAEVRIQVEDNTPPTVVGNYPSSFSVVPANDCDAGSGANSGTTVRLPQPSGMDACTELSDIQYSWEGTDPQNTDAEVFAETANRVVCLPNGVTTVTMRVRDQIGNEATPGTLAVTVAANTGGLSINVSGSSGYTNAAVAPITASASGNTGDVNWSASSDSPPTIDSSLANNTRATISFSTEGKYCPVYINATDDNGSASDSNSCFGIDRTEPTQNFKQIQNHARACELNCVGGDNEGDACLVDGDCSAGGGTCEASVANTTEISPEGTCDASSQIPGHLCNSDADCTGGSCDYIQETLPIVFWGEKILLEFTTKDSDGFVQSGVKKVQAFLNPGPAEEKILEIEPECTADSMGLVHCPESYFVEGCNLDTDGCTALGTCDGGTDSGEACASDGDCSGGGTCGDFKNGRMSVSHLDAGQVHVVRIAVTDAAGNVATTDTPFRLSDLNKGLDGTAQTAEGQQDSILQWVSCLIQDSSTPNAGKVFLRDAKDLLLTARTLAADTPGHAFLLAAEAWEKIDVAGIARGVLNPPEETIADQLLRSVSGEIYTIYEKHKSLVDSGQMLDWYPLRNCNASNLEYENSDGHPYTLESYLEREFFFQNNAPSKTNARGGTCVGITESDYVIRVADALALSKSFLSQADTMEANDNDTQALEYYRTAFDGMVMLYTDDTFADLYNRDVKPIGDICTPNDQCETLTTAESYFRSSPPARFGAPTAKTVLNQIERFYADASSGQLVGIPLEAVAKLEEIVDSIRRFNQSVAIIQQNDWKFGKCTDTDAPCADHTECTNGIFCMPQESLQCDGDTDEALRWTGCSSDGDCPNGTCGVPFNNERLVRDIYLNSQKALELMAELPPQIIYTHYWRAALALTTAMVVNFSIYEGATGIYPTSQATMLSSMGAMPDPINLAGQVAECRYSRLMWALTAGRLGDAFDEASIETAINLLRESKCLIIKVYNENYVNAQGTGIFVPSDGLIPFAEFGCTDIVDVGNINDQCYCIGNNNPADDGDDINCDGKDDDCDGSPDDDYVASSCGVEPCTNTSACINGTELPCIPLTPAVTEDRSCDGINNDCDPDEAIDEDWEASSCGLGGCKNYNQCLVSCNEASDNTGEVCAVDSDCPNGACVPEETACIPLPPESETELCDYRDNNCNILVDENLDNDHDGYGCEPGADSCLRVVGGDPILCSIMVKQCSHDSAVICTEDADCGEENTCATVWQGMDNGTDWDCDDSSNSVFPGATEICNYRDDNCDGEIDEGVKNLCGNCDPDCRETTLGEGGEPFTDTGDNMEGTELTEDNEVTMHSDEVDVEFAWVAVTGGGVVSKIDTKTGREVGRYCTALGSGALLVPESIDEPAYGRARGVSGICSACGSCNSGSRTAVDKNSGTVYIANRSFGAHGTVTKVLNIDYNKPLSMRDCVDLNENGRIDTSHDANGNGIIDQGDSAEYFGENDECILWTKRPHYGVDGTDYDSKSRSNGNGDGAFVARALALDGEGDVWLGSWYGKGFWELDPSSGKIKRWVYMDINPYGAVIDSRGILWAPHSCCSQGKIKAVKTTDAVIDLGSFSLNVGEVSGTKTQSWSDRGNYGITVDDQNRVWLGSYGKSDWAAARYDPVSGNWHKGVSSGKSAGQGRGVTTGLDRHTDRWIAWVAQHGGSGHRGRITGFYTDTVCSNDHTQVCSSNSDCSGTCGLEMAGHDDVVYNKYIGEFAGPNGTRRGTIPVGVGIGKGAKVWTNNGSSKNLTAYDPATGAISYFPNDAVGDNGVVSNQDLRGSLYTYSDFTGNVSATITDPMGSYTVDLIACPDTVPLNAWQTISWTAYYPGDSELNMEVSLATANGATVANDNGDGPNDDWTVVGSYASGEGGENCDDNEDNSRTCTISIGDLPLDNGNGGAYRYIRLKGIFLPNTGGEVSGQPQLDALKFARMCVAPNG